MGKKNVKHRTTKSAPSADPRLADLLALRDRVLEDYAECQQACDDDSEFTTGGNGVNAFEALSTLKPLYELAVKCR